MEADVNSVVVSVEVHERPEGRMSQKTGQGVSIGKNERQRILCSDVGSESQCKSHECFESRYE